ncbi:hypothetical protein B0H11DRAFT_2162611 [Mycena galericulata]|nr:hypothetical protein B0H11DRAFT_2162611 [Mycena galericulata]
MYNVFRSTGRDANRSQTHAQMASAFLGGRGKFTPSSLLNCWMKSSDGVLSADSPHLAQMFSTETPYTEIGPIRPALTSFALQTVGKYLARRSEDAVKASGGLHASVKNKDTTQELTWAKFGADTISTVGEILDHHLSAAWYLMDKIAMRRPRTREGVVIQRKTRPSSGVIIHALSDLLFCRSQDANLLPLALPVEIMAYNCRIGTMPAYSTIHRNLKRLSSQEAAFTVTHGRDANGFGFLLFDNVQNLARVRDLRIGRENHMNVGMSALWVFELADKRRYIGHNARASLTVEQLYDFLDQEDADLMGFHQWLEVLVRCIKPLNSQIPDVQALSRGTSKLLAPLEKSVVHPLGPSGKKETIPSELKEGLLDFFAQVGQLPGDYLARKLIVGDPFKSFEIVEPQLQVWHTKWTDLIRIFQTHWGRTSGKSNNPASLGHSAGKIGRPAPSNMKKVEFYPGSQLLYLVLDARMLDCWSLLLKTEDIFAYFDDLEVTNNLPDLAHLSEIAKNLHRTYSSTRARDHAQFDLGRTSTWAKTIPEGSPWVPVDVEDSSLNKTKKKRKSGAQKKRKEEPPKAPCKGDFVLGQAIDFFRDALNSRKIATSVANGDVGRLYECLKYMLFTFSGSTHTNYMSYLLETVVNLELESSPGLRTALLLCEILNLRGIHGHFEEGDYVVEFFNRLLEDVVQRKNAQFDDDFIRNVVSRNLRQIAELKLAWRTGTGMTEKSRTHTDPHSKPEMRTLLKLYRTEQLHSRRLGRQIDDRDTDDFARGVPVEDDNSSDESDESDEELDPVYATRGSMAIINGQLVMDGRDMMDGPSGEDMADERDTEFTMGPEGVDEDEHEPDDFFNDSEAE